MTDLLVRNGKLYPGDPARAWPLAIATRAGRIIWVGPDSDADALVGPATDVIDVEGRLVLPGFIDSHNHVRYGPDEHTVGLGGAGTVGEVKARIAAWLTEHPDADWAEAEQLDHPTVSFGADDLDDVLRGRPAFIFDYSGHGAWVSRSAMRRMGITQDADRLPYGVVERDPGTGEPTGFLSEFATMGLAGPGHRTLTDLIPWGSADRHHRRLTSSLDMAVECGITTVVEPQSGLDDLPLFARVRDDGRLRCRLIVAMYLPPGASLDQLDEFEAARDRYDDDRLRVGPVKLYVDDVIEQHSAELFEPYADAPSTRGATFYTAGEFGDLVTELADLIAVSDNLYEPPPQQIRNCRVDLTVVNGEVVHRVF